MNDKIQEEWRAIEEFEGLYEVSNTGRVKSLNYRRTKKEHDLTPQYKDGYVYVSLVKNGKYYRRRRSRIVLIAFNGIEKYKTQCDHIDRNRANDNLQNLRWATAVENAKNRRGCKNVSSIYKGVYWIPRDKKWGAQLKVSGKIYQKRTKTEKEAMEAYDKIAIQYGILTNRALLNGK